MTTRLRAIETLYKNFRFRSRLEARWAHFFSVLGVAWEYEPEGYELGGTRYLPDFWLPASRTIVEVKPRRGEQVDAKPMAAVTSAPDLFRFRSNDPDVRQMIVVYGDPLAGEADRIAWAGEPWVLPQSMAQVCLTCRMLRFTGDQQSVWSIWQTACPCGDLTLPKWQAFVADAALAARQARFEYGEHPETIARLEHQYHDAAPNIYLAGKIREDDWRTQIGVSRGDYDHKSGTRFSVDSQIETKYRPWTYHGPDLSMMHGEITHGIVNDCIKRVCSSNMLFVWIDRADVHGTMAELGAWNGLGGGHVSGFSFVAFASRELQAEVWFASSLATVSVVVPTARQAWDAFLEWEEYSRCYQGSVP